MRVRQRRDIFSRQFMSTLVLIAYDTRSAYPGVVLAPPPYALIPGPNKLNTYLNTSQVQQASPAEAQLYQATKEVYNDRRTLVDTNLRNIVKKFEYYKDSEKMLTATVVLQAAIGIINRLGEFEETMSKMLVDKGIQSELVNQEISAMYARARKYIPTEYVDKIQQTLLYAHRKQEGDTDLRVPVRLSSSGMNVIIKLLTARASSTRLASAVVPEKNLASVINEMDRKVSLKMPEDQKPANLIQNFLCQATLVEKLLNTFRSSGIPLPASVLDVVGKIVMKWDKLYKEYWFHAKSLLISLNCMQHALVDYSQTWATEIFSDQIRVLAKSYSTPEEWVQKLFSGG